MFNKITYPNYMVGSNAEKQVAVSFFNGDRITTSLFMTKEGTVFLIEELALQIRGDYLIEITKLRSDEV